MPGKNTYFISDLHLGASYLSSKRQSEMRVVQWLDHIKDDAAQIFLLGDILDYWFEYKHVVPKGFVRFFGKIAELADSGIKITWITGNHDIWIFNYLPSELGIRVVEGPIVEVINGSTFLLDHGDHVGKHPAPYRIMRAIFHNKFCQWLYSSIHPRWTIPFATGWSKESRTSRSSKSIHKDIAKGTNILTEFCETHSAANPEIDFYVFGHIHTMLDKTLSTSKRMIILGEWITTCSFAKFDGNELSLLKAR